MKHVKPLCMSHIRLIKYQKKETSHKTDESVAVVEDVRFFPGESVIHVAGAADYAVPPTSFVVSVEKTRRSQEEERAAIRSNPRLERLCCRKLRCATLCPRWRHVKG